MAEPDIGTKKISPPWPKSGPAALPPLLESLVGDHLDPGYAAAARRKTGAPQRRSPLRGRLSYLLAGFALAGLVLGIALTSTRDAAPSAEVARQALIGDIGRQEAHQSTLAAQGSALAGQVRASQSALGAAGPLATVEELEQQAALTGVTGPGLTIVIDDTSDSDPVTAASATADPATGVILDSDIQLLVNSLWSAGAEAVSVGGVRLVVTSAIRQAGDAILVDNRPVFWPITIQAVGDPSTMHVKFVDTVGFGRFSSFASLYGIRFDLSASTSLDLPAAASVDLQYASVSTAARVSTESPGTGVSVTGTGPSSH